MSGDIVDLPLAQVYPGPLVRAERLDLDHVSVLQDVDVLPPITVRKTGKGYECLDGAHRCAARQRDGFDTVRAVVREADDAEALEIAYSANKEHGLPLTLAERKAGARKLLAGTQLSDASISAIVGLGRDTIAAMRPGVQGAVSDTLNTRKGADGKEYPTPAVAAAARRRAEAAYAKDQTLSVRALAKLAGCSTGTAQDVISKFGQQDGPAAPPAGPPTGSAASPPSASGDQRDDSEEGSPTAPGKHLGVVPPIEPGAPTVADTVPHYPTPGKWHEADGAKATNAARDFAKFMDRRTLRSDEKPADVAAACPAPLRSQAIACARVQAAAWAALAESLEAPARLESAR